MGDRAEASEKRVPGRVHLLGQIVDRSLLAKIYANCDALIHPNPREPFGIAPLEAMASGLPVVAPRFGGVLSYANEDNSWLAEPSGESFADAVRQVFGQEDARRTKVDAALRTAEEFSWSRVTARFFQLYDDLFAQLGSAPALYSLEMPGPRACRPDHNLSMPSWSKPTTTRPPATTMGRRIRFGSEAIRRIASRRDGG